MFADPIANVTFDSVSQTLPRISTAGRKSIYQTADNQFIITVSHTQSKNRTRSMFRLDVNDEDAGTPITAGLYLVWDRPVGAIFDETYAVNIFSCLTGALSASTNAGFKKLNGGES